MTRPVDRRGFLHGLVSLPLIGGGVTLIGNPTASAEPVTERLLGEYRNWLSFESYRAGMELYGPDLRERDWYALSGPAYRWHCRMQDDHGQKPSARAEVVLSAVGCDWRGAS